MSLFTLTTGTEGGALSSQSLAAGAGVSFNVLVPSVYAAELQVENTCGSGPSGTNGVQVAIYRITGASSKVDTNAALQFVIPTVASTDQCKTIELGPGNYKVTLTNLDATYSVTVAATVDYWAS